MDLALFMKAAHFIGRCAVVASLFTLFILSLAFRSEAQTPQPPCGVEASPQYASPGLQPSVEVWRAHDLPQGWKVPACLSWNIDHTATIVALAGTFRYTGTVDDLAARFGAISATNGIRYWSVTDQEWRVLVTDAFALTGAGGSRRPDFSASEVMTGSDIYFAQADNRSSTLVQYQMRVQGTTPDRLVVTVENITAVSWLGFTVFNPGSLKSAYFLTRQTKDFWTYYGFGMVGSGAMSWLSNDTASYINRAAAFFRHYAGIPTDEDPPVAPR